MLNVTKELTALARKLGYTGKAPDTVAKAINAITSVAGSDSNPGYEVVKTQLFSETVTTADHEGMVVGPFAYDSQINSPLLTVTFNGTDYQCTAIEVNGAFMYGGVGETGPDFTNYPFAISSLVDMDGGNEIYTETAGSYNVVVNANVVEVSEEFNAAVNTCIEGNLSPMLCVEGVTTRDEIMAAGMAHRLLYFYNNDDFCFVIFSYSSIPIGYFPENVGMSVGYNEDDIFTITYNEATNNEATNKQTGGTP